MSLTAVLDPNLHPDSGCFKTQMAEQERRLAEVSWECNTVMDLLLATRGPNQMI